MPDSSSPRRELNRQSNKLARRDPRAIVELARQHSSRAIRILCEIMEDAGAPPAVRVKAAETIIERGYGKAPIAVTLDDKTTSGQTINGRVLSIAEKILMLKMAQEQRGETVDLENSQLKIAAPVMDAELVTAEPVEDLVG